MTKLSDTHASILSAAAQRPDGNLLPLPGSLRGGAATKVVGALLTRRLIREQVTDCVAKADAASKATGLAKGIEEAMKCTAFGLITAVFALLMMGLLNGKTQKIIDDINAASVQVLNLVVGNRSKVDLQNLPAE